MFVDDITFKDIDYIVEHLCEKAITELKEKFNDEYKFETLAYLTDVEFENIKCIRLKENNEPVALFGVIPLENNSAGIFFLSTDNLYKGNMIHFLKGTKSYIDNWNQKYKILFDDCYKKNDSVIKWLKFLKFEPTESGDENFQIYKREYKK